ncbi:MAG: ABC transporter permease [Planctomycetes bacterium]|nr:ABC transporter permease [Planctomycetota bacterium]
MLGFGRLHTWELVRLGLASLWRYKLRSFLTMLGIIFGIAAVMAMLGVGAGAEQELIAQMEKLGLRNIFLNSVRPPEVTGKEQQDAAASINEYGLEFRDLERIRARPTIARALPVQNVEQDIWLGSRQISGKAFGVVPAYQRVLSLGLEKGRFITDADEERAARVCVITRSLLEESKYLGDPLAMILSIGGILFRVVGVIESDEFQTATRKAMDLERQGLNIYIPYQTAYRRFGTTVVKQSAGSFEQTKVELHTIVVEVMAEDAVEATAREVQRILDLHERKDTEMIVPLEKLRQSQRTRQVFDRLMLMTAAISLLVGGIGIVNIMLATITERTREIGIRRALGARRGDIVAQFLVETTILSFIGGVLGCVLGLSAIHFIRWIPELKGAVVTFPVIATSVAISCGIGIIFGLYPARKASLMNPIAALRHE